MRKENALKELALELRNRENLVEKYDKLKADYKKVSVKKYGNFHPEIRIHNVKITM